MAKIKTISAISAALALALAAIDAAIAKRDELQAELDNAKAAADIRPGYVVTFSTGRADTRVLRFGAVKLIKDGGEDGVTLKVESGEGFEAEYFTVEADGVLSAGPADKAGEVYATGEVAFNAAVARAAARKPKVQAPEAPDAEAPIVQA